MRGSLLNSILIMIYLYFPLQVKNFTSDKQFKIKYNKSKHP